MERIEGIVTILYVSVFVWRRARQIARIKQRVGLLHKEGELLRLTRIPHEVRSRETVTWSLRIGTAVTAVLKFQCQNIRHRTHCRTVIGSNGVVQRREVNDCRRMRPKKLLSSVLMLCVTGQSRVVSVNAPRTWITCCRPVSYWGSVINIIFDIGTTAGSITALYLSAAPQITVAALIRCHKHALQRRRTCIISIIVEHIASSRVRFNTCCVPIRVLVAWIRQIWLQCVTRGWIRTYIEYRILEDISPLSNWRGQR